jgi:hypothetical protein
VGAGPDGALSGASCRILIAVCLAPCCSPSLIISLLNTTPNTQYLSTHRPQVQAALGGGGRARRYSEFDPFYSQLYR